MIENELKSRDKSVDILDIASGVAPLVRRGSHYFMCCPFHEDKSASLCLYAKSNTYHCFGCQESGDVFKFVQKIEKTSKSKKNNLKEGK